MLLNKSYSVLLAFLLLTVTLSTAQNTAIDSLKRVIVAAKIDTAKANACNAIANAFKEIDPDSTNHYAQARQQNFSEALALAYLKSYIKTDGGYVIMADNTNIPIAQRKKERLQELIKSL